MGDSLPTSMGGLPSGIPERPATPPAYPAIHDLPPQRPLPVLDDDAQKKMEKDLIAVRDRQEGKKKGTPPQTAKPLVPAKSRDKSVRRRAKPLETPPPAQ